MKKLSIATSYITLFLLTAQNAFAQPAPPGIVISPGADFVPSDALTINKVISFGIGLLFAIAVIAAVAFLIWGGIRWITSGGDKGKVDTARGTIVASIIGLVVVLLTFVILNFVVQILGIGSNILDLCIPTLTGTANGCVSGNTPATTP